MPEPTEKKPSDRITFSREHLHQLFAEQWANGYKFAQTTVQERAHMFTKDDAWAWNVASDKDVTK